VIGQTLEECTDPRLIDIIRGLCDIQLLSHLEEHALLDGTLHLEYALPLEDVCS
jgi:hypothetical protein